jgi:membrane associated rhomboid family serine protease
MSHFFEMKPLFLLFLLSSLFGFFFGNCGLYVRQQFFGNFGCVAHLMGTRIHRGPALANEPKATADCGGD